MENTTEICVREVTWICSMHVYECSLVGVLVVRNYVDMLDAFWTWSAWSDRCVDVQINDRHRSVPERRHEREERESRYLSELRD